MSYPYPQDRHRDRREEGEEPYAGDKQQFAQARSQQAAEAEAWGETHQRPSEPDRSSLEENLQAAAQEVQRSLGAETDH